MFKKHTDTQGVIQRHKYRHTCTKTHTHTYRHTHANSCSACGVINHNILADVSLCRSCLDHFISPNLSSLPVPAHDGGGGGDPRRPQGRLVAVLGANQPPQESNPWIIHRPRWMDHAAAAAATATGDFEDGSRATWEEPSVALSSSPPFHPAPTHFQLPCYCTDVSYRNALPLGQCECL